MKTLIAGFGNLFRCDDALGCALVRMLADVDLGQDVRLRDFGTGGMQLALEMSSGYDRVIILDAVARAEPPGTVFAIDCTADRDLAPGAPDAHAMSIGAVLALYDWFREHGGAAAQPQIVVLGCVPQNLADGMELSEPVKGALPICIDMVRKLVRSPIDIGVQV